MALDVRLVVTDASPLITLAAARSLDFLLYPGLPVVIPDAVFHEATAAADKLGAQEIIAWYRANEASVRIEPTEAFQDAIRLGLRRRDLGERAAIEAVRASRHLDASDHRALLLADDRDVVRLVATDPEKVILLTTWDYLRQLEAAGRIQSADATLALARDAGRMASRRGLWDNHDPAIRDAVAAILSRRG